MEQSTKLEFDVIPTNPGAAPLSLEVWVGQDKIFDSVVAETIRIDHTLDDSIEQEHNLRFILKNKTDSHTTINDNGEVIQDSLICIENLKFDDLNIDPVLQNLGVYTHDFNGHGNRVDDKFFGPMGCNGTVSLKFTTPVYLWLLENM